MSTTTLPTLDPMPAIFAPLWIERSYAIRFAEIAAGDAARDTAEAMAPSSCYTGPPS